MSDLALTPEQLERLKKQHLAFLTARLGSDAARADWVRSFREGYAWVLGLPLRDVIDPVVLTEGITRALTTESVKTLFAPIAREIHRRVGPLRMLDHKGMNRRAAELFRELKSETRADDLVRFMSGGQRQAVAIARTRLARSKLVLMDEPTAAISVRQVAEVLDLIRRLRDAGTAVMLISHRMPDVFTVCDRVVVMRRGRKVADKRIAASSPEEVTGLITGAIEAA